MAAQILAKIPCDACGIEANVKKRANSALLYIHCPDCGLDQRSGKKQQERLKALVEGSEQGENTPEAQPVSETPPERLEWKPELTEKDTTEQSEPEKPRTSTALKAALGVTLTVTGLFWAVMNKKG